MVLGTLAPALPPTLSTVGKDFDNQTAIARPVHCFLPVSGCVHVPVFINNTSTGTAWNRTVPERDMTFDGPGAHSIMIHRY